MKTKLITLAVTMMLESLSITAQTTAVYIPWENGQVSLLSEMEPVWIILKKGSDLKNVRLWEIQNSKGILIYKKDGTLHDLPINKIDRITAGANSKSAIFFNDENKATIKAVEVDYYNALNYSDFKVNSAAQLAETQATKNFISSAKTESGAQTIPEEKRSTIVYADNKEARDTIVKSDGEILAVMIMEITPTRIKFKKANNMDGPAYIVGNQPSVRITRKPNSTKIILSDN